MNRIRCSLTALVLMSGWSVAFAAPPKPAPPPPKLTEAGEQLRARYAEMLGKLQADLRGALPAVDGGKRADLDKALAAVKAAQAEKDKAKQNLDKIGSAAGLVEHAKGKWIGGAEKGIAAAQAALKKATTDAERQTAMAELAKWEANKQDGLKALQERQAALDKIKPDEAKFKEANKAADEALAKARAAETTAARALLADIDPVLAGDKLDVTLCKAVILTDATPIGLAVFAQQDKASEALVANLLADAELMKEMLVAGGAAKGNYGRAAQILADINKASARSQKGHFRRLAIAVSLAHAEPIGQRNAEDEDDASKTVDPVQRYLHYEKAFLAGELDPAFPTLTTWEYRFVVDSYAPDAMLAWGREMLRNYRPDHILNPDYGWRYSGAVRTDVAYKHSNEYVDSADLGFFQNVCKNGGICGRRAFFGRFIVQAFGLPARPFTQPKHAAMVHWTPKGWVVNLGAGWPVGWFPEQRGPEFLVDTQAREFSKEYLRVLRAEWISTTLGEARQVSKATPTLGFWKQLSLDERKAIVETAKATEPAALGADLAEATESKETRAAAVAKAVITDADKKIVTGAGGEIIVPVAACGGGNSLVKSFAGGQQMIFGKALTCTVEVPAAGKYQLTLDVVTVHGEEKLTVTANGAKPGAALAVPFTVGEWRKTNAVEVTLKAGKNTLELSPPAQSFALKSITLIPAR